MAKDAYYFPHFCNARHDRKIKRVRKELGVEGYGLFFMLLEVLREQSDYKYPVEDLDLLADEFGTSEQKVRAVLTNYGLFTVDDEENFFSSNLIMYLQPYLEGKERKRIAGIKGNLIRHGYKTKEELDGATPIEIQAISDQVSQGSHSDRLAIPTASQSKGEEIKEKKGEEINRFPPDGRSEAKELAVAWYSEYSRRTAIMIGPSEKDVQEAWKLLQQTDLNTARGAILNYFDCNEWFIKNKKTGKKSYSFKGFCTHFTEIPVAKQSAIVKPVEQKYNGLSGAKNDE